MVRRLVGRAAFVALLAMPGIASAADGPFCGFFQPRGGEQYSPLHYWAPALYRIKFQLKGPDCPGCRVSVCPPAWSPNTPVASPGPVTVTPVPTGR